MSTLIEVDTDRCDVVYSNNDFFFNSSSVQNVTHSSDEASEENEPLLAREVVLVTSGGDDGDDAISVLQRRTRTSAGSRDGINRSPSHVSSYYNITEIIEMGKMASLFFNKIGNKHCDFYRAFHRFGRAKIRNGGKALGSSPFLLLPQVPPKTMLASKVVKIDSKKVISLCYAKSVTHSVVW